MESSAIAVRLLVTREGVESLIESSVEPEQSIFELNQQHFPNDIDSSSIRWIYFGRPLVDTLPAVINQDSVIHVYVSHF